MNVRDTVSTLIRTYGTSDPFELADYMNVSVLYENLGTVNGYYNKQLRMKQIHINCALDKHLQKYTCAHELGHAVMHPDSSTPFLKASTLFSIDKMEIEANTFAMILLIPDEVILEHCYHTAEQLSRILRYEKALIDLRLKSYRDL